MDMSEFFLAGKSPKRELQGPRPPPLSVRKDSHKIRKPPVAPANRCHHPPAPPPRQPVIIYAVSPKVIHTNPNEFMALVQRLTGPSPKFSNPSHSSSSSPRVDQSNPFFISDGTVSPAARYATMENAAKSSKTRVTNNRGDDVSDDLIRVVEMTGLMPPGILSPCPASLHPVPATFFSPPSNTNPLSFLHDLVSPAGFNHHRSLNYSELSSLLQSPPPFISPLPSMDLFNHFFDL